MAMLRRALRGNGVGAGKMVCWTNETSTPAYVGLSTPLAGKVVPVELNRTGAVLVKTPLFLCSMASNQITLKEVRLGLDASSSQGNMLMHRVSGTGMCFIQAGGAAVEKVLGEGEKMFLEMGSVAAYSESCTVKVERRPMQTLPYAQGFMVKFTGPGTVFIQSTFISRLSGAAVADRLANRPGGVLLDVLRSLIFIIPLLIVWILITDI
ncbi:unnamed protein product [Discosporangium mesarthrocarpum]